MDEAKQALSLLEQKGASPDAFTFACPFPQPLNIHESVL
jgi:hypothetical protein